MLQWVLLHYVTSPILFGSAFFCIILFRDIIQRVADVMKMYGFIHVAEAFAVRTLCCTRHLLRKISRF